MSSSEDSNPDDYIVWFEFKGKPFEYFCVWIVNLMLSLVTLGIYSAWAKVRKLRYIYGNTSLAGHAFSYLADPLKILKGRLIAVLIIVLYTLMLEFVPQSRPLLLTVAAIVIPYIIITSASFQRRNSSYRHVRFLLRREFGDAYRMLAIPLVLLALVAAGFLYFVYRQFEADIPKQNTWELIGTFFEMMVASIVFVIPYLDYVRSRFLMGRTQFGVVTAEFDASVFRFYWLYFSSTFLWGIFLAALMFLQSRIFEFFEIPEPFYLSLIVIYLSMFLLFAMIRARRTNLILESVMINGHGLVSRLKTLPILWLYVSNTVMILLSLGMLTPYAKVRMLRYITANTGVVSSGLEQIESTSMLDETAYGEELSEVFELDFGL